MKRLLSIIGAISLFGTSTTSLVACNKPQYNEKELTDLKEKNNITTKDGVLEWMAPQEKPFDKVDSKYYYVVWKGKKEDNWRLIKFQNNKEIERFKPLFIDKQNENTLNINKFSEIPIENDLTINASTIIRWKNDNGKYFKSVYRWNLLDKPSPDLIIDENGNLKVKGE